MPDAHSEKASKQRSAFDSGLMASESGASFQVWRKSDELPTLSVSVSESGGVRGEAWATSNLTTKLTAEDARMLAKALIEVAAAAERGQPR